MFRRQLHFFIKFENHKWKDLLDCEFFFFIFIGTLQFLQDFVTKGPCCGDESERKDTLLNDILYF